MRFQEWSYQHLIPDIANGNQHAFSKLYDLFYPSLLEHVVSKVNDIPVAEDILHDLFLSIWKNRQKLPEIESLPAYLYSSCRYLVIDHIRKSSQQQVYADLSDFDSADNEPALEERLYYRYLLDAVNKEIENLPEKCRQIFKLSREEHLSNKEIAAAMNVSESTVENQINKALKRIRAVRKHFFIHFFCM